jgi:chemotaxis protein methyltransferase CheR
MIKAIPRLDPSFDSSPFGVGAGRASIAEPTHQGVVGRELEFVWTDADFGRVQSLIYERAGISLHEGKHAMVYSRLSRRLRETGHQSFKEYLGSLEAGEGPEWQEFVNALTTNLTSFFRESHHFEILASHLKGGSSGRPWRIWCSAASTGEEPYSIAMTAVEALGERGEFSLVASDIDSKVLATASQGVYRIDGLKGLDDDRLSRFFMKGRAGNMGLARIKPVLQSKVRFVNVNLIRGEWPFDDLFDLVFCRNVMIYFDPPTQRKVLERIHRAMIPGGLLFVGHAENFSDSRDLFVLKGKTVYERC